MNLAKIAVVRATWPVWVEAGDGSLSVLSVSTWYQGATIGAAKRCCPVETATFEVLADPAALPPLRRPLIEVVQPWKRKWSRHGEAENKR